MEFFLANPNVFLANYVAPLIIGYLCCLRWGPNRGALYGVVPALIVVFVLFFFQVGAGTMPDGTGRPGNGFRYMMDEGIYWVASFLTGCAIGSVQRKSRNKRG